jgi:hypothetical protein
MGNFDLTRQSLRRVEERGPDLPLFCAPAPADPWTQAAEGELDDATLAYVLAARPPFDLLREATGQLAALLVLAAAGGRSAQDNPVFALACASQAEAQDMIGSLRPNRRSAHHHRHLRACSQAVGGACREAALHLHQRHDQRALTLLREGLEHLQFAAGALPGFEVVAFGQSCCAAHAIVNKTPREKADG